MKKNNGLLAIICLLLSVLLAFFAEAQGNFDGQFQAGLLVKNCSTALLCMAIVACFLFDIGRPVTRVISLFFIVAVGCFGAFAYLFSILTLTPILLSLWFMRQAEAKRDLLFVIPYFLGIFASLGAGATVVRLQTHGDLIFQEKAKPVQFFFCGCLVGVFFLYALLQLVYSKSAKKKKAGKKSFQSGFDNILPFFCFFEVSVLILNAVHWYNLDSFDSFALISLTFRLLIIIYCICSAQFKRRSI